MQPGTQDRPEEVAHRTREVAQALRPQFFSRRLLLYQISEAVNLNSGRLRQGHRSRTTSRDCIILGDVVDHAMSQRLRLGPSSEIHEITAPRPEVWEQKKTHPEANWQKMTERGYIGTNAQSLRGCIEPT
jgi:hypothetical protein